MSYVHSVTWSPSGRFLASGSDDGAVVVWETDTGRISNRLAGQTETIHALAWSPDNRKVASGSGGSGPSGDHMIIWDLESNSTLTTAHFTGWISGLGWSWNGRLFASASANQETIEVRDGVTLSPLYGLTLPDTDTARTAQDRGTAGIVSMAWAPDAEQLAIGMFNGLYHSTVVVWDVANRRLRLILRGHSQPVYSVAWSPDSKWLASGGNDGHVIIWNATTGERHLTLRGHTDKVFALAWSPNGKQLASGGSDGRLIVWDPKWASP